MASRIACLLVPSFPLAARLRAEPEAGGAALVVLSDMRAGARVVAASPEARRAGVGEGLTWAQARAMLPGLLARERQAPGEDAARRALLSAAEAFSPRLEEAEPGVVFLDVAGEPDEKGLALGLLARARRERLPARVGVAGGMAAARAAAESCEEDGWELVPAGQDQAFLAPRPLSCLRPPAAAARTLERWGLRRVGELARLPEGEVSSRLGRDGWLLHRAARGLDARPLVPRRPASSFSDGAGFDWPISDLSSFTAAAAPVLLRLAEKLAERGLASRRLELAFELDPQGREARALELAAPTADARTWLALLALELERHPPRAPVTGLSALAVPEEPRAAQLTLFGPPALSPDALSTTIARLAALVGEDRVGCPAAKDTRRPESFGLKTYAPPPPPEQSVEGAGEVTRAAFTAVRVLRPAAPLEVLCVGEEPRRARSLDPSLPLCGDVVVAAGPWRMLEGWWGEDPVERDYWDLELSDQGLYRVYYDLRRKRWYADGIYD